jgi:hypothetical protein
MDKRQVVPQSYIDVLENIADIMKLERHEENKLVDFKPGDVVKSSILQGLHRVEVLGANAILVSSLKGDKICYPVHPKYLKKVDINEKTVDILYNGRSEKR